MRKTLPCHLWAMGLLAAFLLLVAHAPAKAADELRVGVLKFGTVNWQLDSLTHHGFDLAENVKVLPLPLASKNATAVALQAGEVDMIVSDWVWVLRQRASGADFLFYPYSTSLGALVADKAGSFSQVADLAQRRLGIAGGPLDKSWLILQSWALQRDNLDLTKETEAVFGAPPLLSEQLRADRLDGLLTFWPFAARLEAQGHHRVVAVSDLLSDLGLTGKAFLVGYVFPAGLAEDRAEAVNGFFRALARTNALLAESDEEWVRLRPLMRAATDEEFAALVAGYRAGIPTAFGDEELADTAKLFDILSATGGEKLLGEATVFDPGAFWTGPAR